MGLSGFGREGGAMRCLVSQASMQSQITLAMMSGVCCFLRCSRNVAVAAVRVVWRVSLRHCSTWLVSSQSPLQSKHRPLLWLLKVWSRFAVGRRSFINLDNCMRCPMDNLRNDSSSGCQAIVSNMALSHLESRPVAVWDRWRRYVFMGGACAAVRR